MAESKPLAGLLVIDASQGIAGPSCGSHMAEYGARVIKIEPPSGDWMRGHGTQIDGTSPPAIAYNRGKESLALDLKQPEGRDVALALARKAAVFIESSRPGVMQRLGLGFQDLERANPDIVYLSISGWGQRGPNRELPMVDTVAQAISGLMSVTRSRDGAPVKVNATLIDAVTGLYAFQAVAMALWGKRPGSGARHLDINLLQAAAHLQGYNILEFGYVGGPPGLLNPPAGNYRTKDDWLAVTLVTEAQFGAICTAIGEPELARDPRFDTFQRRKANVAALTAILDAALATRTTAEWVERFTAAGALASRINTHGDWLADPHVEAVAAAPAYALANGETVRLPHLPGAPPFTGAVPRIGQHTMELLAEAGLAPADIDQLITRGIARTDETVELGRGSVRR
jgi:crotonobetainyl-CoA:carnitine CoA-transferase CaiB-like acyl-CoA transferase